MVPSYIFIEDTFVYNANGLFDTKHAYCVDLPSKVATHAWLLRTQPKSS